MELPVKQKKPFLKKYKNEIRAYLLIGIPLLWWGIFFIYALLRAVYFSFTDLEDSILNISKFSLEHYARVFAFGSEKFDPKFWRALGVSLLWTVVMLVANNFMGLFIAWLLSTLQRGRKVIFAFLFWPSLISSVVSAHIIKIVFDRSGAGLANRLIMMFGGQAQNWLGNESTALFALMALPILLGFSGRLVIFYAAMLGVPKTYYEAARLDTDSKSKTLFHITLPLIKNSIILNVVLSLIEGIKILSPMLLVTEGKSGTTSSVLYIYQLAFSPQSAGVLYSSFGRASAYAMVVFTVILLLTLLQFKISGKEAENVSAG